MPEQWIIEHKVCLLPHTFFSNFPFLHEMQYLILLAAGGDVPCKLLHWFNGVLSAAAAGALAAAFFGPRAGAFAAAAYLSQPTMRFLQHVTMVELGITWFETLATAAVIRAAGWWPSGRGGARGAWLCAAGCFLGYAQGTKYIGLFCSVILLAGWLAATWPRPRALAQPGSSRGPRTARSAVGGALLLVAFGSAFTLPWLGKNWLFTGDPFFPMLQGLFPAINWDAPHYVTWMHDNSKYGSGHGSLLAWLTMPVLASIDTAHFGTFTLNPFALLFVPFLLLVRRPPPGVTFLAAYAGLYFAIWAGSSQQTRFLHPVVPQGMAVAAALLFAPATATRWFRWPVALAAAWIFAVSWFGQVQNRYSNNALWPYTMGHLNPNELKNIGVSYHEAVKTVNRVVGARDRVLFVGADESFNCARRRSIACPLFSAHCTSGTSTSIGVVAPIRSENPSGPGGRPCIRPRGSCATARNTNSAVGRADISDSCVRMDSENSEPSVRRR